ncbi:MAG: hypothetical protein OSB41_11815, partial [Kiritimatiellae bacterium]|nr:hypothetical protein [Kiritimatiellia bacterium]
LTSSDVNACRHAMSLLEMVSVKGPTRKGYREIMLEFLALCDRQIPPANVDDPALDKKRSDIVVSDIWGEPARLVPPPRPKSPQPVRPAVAPRPTQPKDRISPLLRPKAVASAKPKPVAAKASPSPKKRQGESRDTAKEEGNGRIADTIRSLETQAEEAARLREQVAELTAVNTMLQTKVSGDAEKAVVDPAVSDEAQRRLNAQVHELRQQIHVANARAEAAELARSQTESEVTPSTLVPAETETFLKAIVEARAALAEACKCAAAQQTGQGHVVEQQLNDIASQYKFLDSNIGDLVETHQRLAASYQAERTQWEGVERMARAKRVEDDSDMDQVDASLRQRIALLESALAEYKNKEAKSGFAVGPAKHENDDPESAELVARIATLEKQNETHLSALREELQSVIGSLRKENTELNDALSAKTTSGKEDTGEWTAKLKALRVEHQADLEKLKSAHQSDLATRAKSAPQAASVASKDSGADVVGLKKENLSLSQRDADQSMAIADLKEQVAKLYGEMSTRQKDALSRFKQREEELKVEMSALAAGAPASAPAKPSGDDPRVAELKSELVTLEKRAKAAEAATAAQQEQIKASNTQAERLAAAEKDLGAKAADEKKAEQGAKALAAKAAEQEKALADARAAWEKREKEMSAKIESLSAAADKKPAPKPVDDTELKKSLERIKSLEADVETLSAKSAATQKEPVPSEAAAVETPVAATPWFLRLDDGKVFGPVPLTELLQWAVDCRIGPEHQVSLDKKDWKSASEVDELRMQWKVKLEDGEFFGPVNLFAVSQLIQDGVVGSDPELAHKTSGKSASFSTLISEEIKVLLGREKELVKALAQKKPAGPPPPKGRKRSTKK